MLMSADENDSGMHMARIQAIIEFIGFSDVVPPPDKEAGSHHPFWPENDDREAFACKLKHHFLSFSHTDLFCPGDICRGIDFILEQNQKS